MSAVWAHSPYRGEALLLHLALADYANDEGTCFPSQKTLARKARCSENYVRVAIKRMISDGLVEIIEPSNGRGRAITYQLKPHSLDAPLPKPHSPDNKTPLATKSTPYSINHHKPPYEDDFEQFWEKYPRKVAKGVARKVWQKLWKAGTLPALDKLLTSVEAYEASVTEKRFLAYPATWLTGERWLDNLGAKWGSVVVTEHRNARSFGAVMRATGRTEQQLQESIAHYSQPEQDAAIQAYREGK
jgi:hypothetical protein